MQIDRGDFMSNSLSMRIKELRTSKNLTQKEFAETLNISTVSVSSYETGVKTPSLDMIINISKRYNVSIDWLCGLSDKMTLDKQITTYKDLFQLLIAVLDTRYVNKKDSPVIDEIDAEFSAVRFTFHDDVNIQNFFSKWRDMFALYSTGTIDEELYQMWLEKQLKEYDRPINEVPF